MADGDYSVIVPEPTEEELKTLVGSINALGTSLRTTEEKRAQLVSDLAHELRNPLTAIEGYMEALIDGVLPANEDTYGVVAKEAGRLKRLTNDLSLLAKVQESALDLTITRLDLSDVVSDVTERLRPQYESKGVELVVDVGMPLEVDGDRDRLAQALTNVLGNALTHTPAGGAVTITGVAVGETVPGSR